MPLETLPGTSPFPERVGRFELLLPIGVGGMATVYLARMEGAGGFERDVALKLMHPHLRTDASWARGLLDEARLTARIRHGNVVPVLDAGEDPFGVFLVMDYIEGDTLAGLLKHAGEHIPLAIAMRIVTDALAGLHAAHEIADADGAPLHIVHRDFSPQNILVGTDGVTRLADFGIAKSASGDGVTRTGIVKGKLGYMAPEQARGRAVDRRCDVWAAGVVAWELAAGRRLLPPGDEMDRLMRLVNDDPPRVRSVRDDVPAAVDEAIAAALVRDVTKRTPTADELRKRLLAASAIADTGDVAALVASVAGPAMKERRGRALEVLRSRGDRSRLRADPLEAEARPPRIPELNDGTSAPIQPAEVTSADARPVSSRIAPVAPAGAAPSRAPRRGFTASVAGGALALGILVVSLVRFVGTRAPSSPAASAVLEASTGLSAIAVTPDASGAPPSPLASARAEASPPSETGSAPLPRSTPPRAPPSRATPAKKQPAPTARAAAPLLKDSLDAP